MATPTSSDALIVTAGPLAGQTLPLERRELVVGRDAGCDLPLTTYTQLSRRHAKLTPTPNGWAVEDLASTNGTFVDEARVERAPLKHGARLKLGDFEALVRVYAPQPAVQVSVSAPVGTGPVAVAPRQTPKWVWPALGGFALLIFVGLVFGRGSGARVDTGDEAKVRRAVDVPTDSDTHAPRAKSGDTSPQSQAAPPVNGRIAPETVALAKRATVLIVRREPNSIAFGSGFVVGDGHQVVTNRHVVVDEGGAVGDCLLVFEAGTAQEHRVKVSADAITLADGTEQFSSDLARLQLPSDETAPATLALGRSEDLAETDTAWVFGFPLGVGTLTLDQELPSVSVKDAAVERIQRGQVDGGDAAKVIQLGSTVTHGNSGGPVLNAKGEVVGVISQGAEGTGISYAIPTVWVRRLVGG